MQEGFKAGKAFTGLGDLTSRVGRERRTRAGVTAVGVERCVGRKYLGLKVL